MITIDDIPKILGSKPIFLAETKDKYYARPELTEFYDNSMYEIDKNTGIKTYIGYTTYIVDIEDNAKVIEV